MGWPDDVFVYSTGVSRMRRLMPKMPSVANLFSTHSLSSIRPISLLHAYKAPKLKLNDHYLRNSNLDPMHVECRKSIENAILGVFGVIRRILDTPVERKVRQHTESNLP